MLDMNELRQLILFSEKKSLSSVAEECFISTPSVTRSMKHLEEEFGVSLFIRRKNKIELNETGHIAVKAAKSILAEHDRQLDIVRDFNKKQNTIEVFSCAPAPLWQILPTLSETNPDKTVTSRIESAERVIEVYESGSCNYAILPFAYKDFVPLLKEKLFVAVKKDHELAHKKTVSFNDINGFNFLIRSELGFWQNLCYEKMPASKFLVQKDEFEFLELVKSSALPCFATDIGIKRGIVYEERVLIPICDTEATVTFYINAMP